MGIEIESGSVYSTLGFVSQAVMEKEPPTLFFPQALVSAPSCPNHSNSKNPNVFLCSWSRRTKSEHPLVVRRSDGTSDVSQGQPFRGQRRMMSNRTLFSTSHLFLLSCTSSAVTSLSSTGGVCWNGRWSKASLCGCSVAKSCLTLCDAMD